MKWKKRNGIMMIYRTVLPYVNGLFRIDYAISIARMIDLSPNLRRLSWHAYSFRHHVFARCCHQLSSIKDSILSPSCLHAQWRIDAGSSTVNWILSRLFLNNILVWVWFSANIASASSSLFRDAQDWHPRYAGGRCAYGHNVCVVPLLPSSFLHGFLVVAA